MLIDLDLPDIQAMRPSCMHGRDRNVSRMQYAFRSQTSWVHGWSELDAVDGAHGVDGVDGSHGVELRLMPFENVFGGGAAGGNGGGGGGRGGGRGENGEAGGGDEAAVGGYSTLESQLGVECDAPIPHLNGAATADAGRSSLNSAISLNSASSASPEKQVNGLTEEQEAYLREVLYHDDSELYRAARKSRQRGA